MGTKIAFARPDGKETAGYLAKPRRANAPGIIVIQNGGACRTRSRVFATASPLQDMKLSRRSLFWRGRALSRP